MYGIEARESGAGLLVELWGEFDVFCTGELRRVLNDVASRRVPVFVDLSGITFLDLRSARELAVRSMLHARRPTFLDPSPQVAATMRAIGLASWPNVPQDNVHETPLASEPGAGSRFLYVSPS